MGKNGKMVQNSNNGGNTMNENEEMQMIPYYVHESDLARMERQIKRLWIVLIMTIVFLVATNAAWIWYESSFEDVVVTQENSDGVNNYVGNDGSIYNYPEANDEQ